MQQLIITPNDVKENARDMSKHIDDNRIITYIRETQDIDVKNALGDALLIDVADNIQKYEELLCGGTYTARSGENRYFSGLRRAMSYYAYARIMKNGDYNVTRFGTVNKDSEYSSNAAYKEKVTAYNDAFSIADSYLKEVVRYLNENKERYPLYKGLGKIKSNRTRYKVLGE